MIEGGLYLREAIRRSAHASASNECNEACAIPAECGTFKSATERWRSVATAARNRACATAEDGAEPKRPRAPEVPSR